MTTTQRIKNAFKHINSSLVSIPSKELKKLVRTQLWACFDAYGNLIGFGNDPQGVFNIQMNQIDGSKGDVTRECNLVMEECLLAWERSLREKINK